MKITELIKLLNPRNSIVNNSGAFVSQVKQATAADISESTIMWVSEKNNELLKTIHSGNVICSANTPQELLNNSCNYILVDNPRASFRQLLQEVFAEKEEAFISSRATIDPTAVIAENVTIGHNTVIAANCQIGSNTIIGHNTVIHRNTVIGNNVVIGSNNTIGGVGFGYEKNESGEYELIPHIGNVIIEDGVEIGNNSTIDRGVIGSTILRANAKVDNLVHIAHGVTVGENSLIIANAMVAGSVIIGRNVWVAPSTSVLNNKKIGDNAVIGMGAVVLKDVEPDTVIVGNPGKKLTRGE